MERFQPSQGQNPVKELQRFLEEFRGKFNNLMKDWGPWAVGIIFLGLYLLSGFYIVGPGEKGVELLFGKLYSITGPGLHYRLPKPFMEQILVNISKVRRVEIGFRSDGTRTRSVPAESLMLTGDGNIVAAQLVIQYIIEDPVKFLFGVEAPENTLRASAEVAVRVIIGQNTIDSSMTSGRAEVQEGVATYVQELLNKYDTGLRITMARLLAVDPPEQVQDAFHDVVRAEEDRQRLVKEAEVYSEDVIPKARIEAQQMIREAEAYKIQKVIRAKGDVERFSLLLEEYLKAPGVTRERLYLESVEKFLTPARKFVFPSIDSKISPVINLSEPAIDFPAPAPAQSHSDSGKSLDRKTQ